MVHIRDEGSLFDAPIAVVWKYAMGGPAHDGAHKTTRKPGFKPLSKTSLIYSSERKLNGRWAKEQIQITIFHPLGFAFEWIEGVLKGSKMFYVYSSKGKKTQIDVYGEFSSPTLSPAKLKRTVARFLDNEFNEDAPVIRAFARMN
jgi:hypothetical protein